MSSGRGRTVSLEIRALACLFLAGLIGSAVAAAVPFHPGRPVYLLTGVAALCAVLAAGLYFAGHRLGRRATHVLLALLTVTIGLTVMRSATMAGAMISGYALTWIAIFAAYFLPLRHAVLHAAGISASFGAALVVAGYPVATPLVVLSGSVFAATLGLGDLVRRLNEQARTDQLTGLLNRFGFREVAARQLALAQRTGAQVTVAVIDLDAFKEVNDRAGHAAGDELLRDLAEAWRGELRDSDVVGREGGDEFVLLLPSTSRSQAAELLARLAAASPASWSAGLAEWWPGEDLSSCLMRADAALYEVKVGRDSAGDLPHEATA